VPKGPRSAKTDGWVQKKACNREGVTGMLGLI